MKEQNDQSLTYYTLPEEKGEISGSELAKRGKEFQKEVMKKWFYENYEHPAERTPYETAEWGYQWIYGGPYSPDEELSSEFADLVDEEVIDELSEELWNQSPEWTRPSLYDDIDEDYFELIANTSPDEQEFIFSTEKIAKLLGLQVGQAHEEYFYCLLFTNIISALETYLAEVFISSVVHNEKNRRKFIETTQVFAEHKISLSKIYQYTDKMQDHVKEYLLNLSWHNLKKIKKMFNNTLGVSFSKDTAELERAIEIRHDLVHRNGKAKDGTRHMITKKMVLELIQTTRRFVGYIDHQLNH